MAKGSYIAQQEEILSRMRPEDIFVLENFNWLKYAAYAIIGNADEPATGADAKPQAVDVKPAPAAKPAMHRHYTLKRTAEPAPKPEPSTLSRMFGTR